MTQKEKEELTIELKSRQIVRKKLDSIIGALDKDILLIKADRIKRKNELLEYKSETELQDAYGWGFITEEEYDALLAAWRSGTELIDNEKTAKEIAQEILRGWRKIILSDIDALQFELLPDKKKEEIRKRNYEIAQRRANREEKRNV